MKDTEHTLIPLDPEHPRMQPGFFVPAHRQMGEADSQLVASTFLQVVRECERDGEDKGGSTLRITNAIKAVVPKHTTVDLVGLTQHNKRWIAALGICWHGSYPHVCHLPIDRWWV